MNQRTGIGVKYTEIGKVGRAPPDIVLDRRAEPDLPPHFRGKIRQNCKYGF